MVIPVDIGFSNGKDVVKEELSKVLHMMAFPVLDPQLQVFDSQLVFGLTLRLIDLVCDSLGSFEAILQLGKVRVILFG